MADQRRTKVQLIEELEQLRRRVREIEGCADLSRNCLPREILEAIEDGIWVADASDKLVYVNPGMGSLAGVPPASLLGLSVTRGFPAETTGRFLSDYREAKRTLRPVTYQIPVVTPAGRETVQAGWLTPRVRGGRFDGMVCTIQDVTDRVAVADELRAVFEMSLDLICIADINTATFLKVNPAFRKTLGYSEAELLGRPFLDFIHPDDVQATRDVLREKLQENVPVFSFTNRYRCKGGDYRHLSWDCHPVAEKGVAYAVARDITKRGQAEEMLRVERDRAQTYLDIAGTMIVALDDRGRITLINREACWLLGYDRDQLLGRDWFDTCLPEELRKSVRDVYVRLMAGDIAPVERYQNPVLTASGELRQIAWHNSVLRDPAGRVTGILSSGEDVTQRRAAEAALQENAARLELATSATNIGLWDWDLRTNRVYFSPLWKAQLGYEDHEIGGRFEEWRDRLHPDDRERALTAVKGYIAGERENYEIEFRLRHKDGSYRWIYTRADMQLDADGKPVRIYGCHVDVTARKRSEESLEAQRGQLMTLLVDAEHDALEREQLEQQLLQAQKMEAIGALAGGVAHDFNNILQAMLGYALLLKEQLPTGSTEASDLMEIEKGCQRAAALTRQLLAFGRRQVMQPMRLDLGDVVAGIVKMLRHVIGEDIELILLPMQRPTAITADRGQVEQVLMNLAVNARDAMPKGGCLTVSTFRRSCDEKCCREHPELTPGEYGVLAVQDTGVGMSAATLRRAFEPFFTTKESGCGTGLGLSTVYGIARQHGGTVTVTSAEGRGTTFEVLLPAADGVPEAETEADWEASGDLRGSGTILVAEDDGSVRQLLSQVLTDAGYTVVAVGDGQTAVEEAQARGAAIDLLILDAVMPVLSGKGAHEQIVAMRNDLPTIFITGYAAGELDGSETIGGAVTLLLKPFSRRQLLEAVQQALHRGAPASAPCPDSPETSIGAPREEHPAG